MSNQEIIEQKTLEKTKELAGAVKDYLNKFDKIDIAESGEIIGWIGDTPYLITINLKLNCYKRECHADKTRKP